jgi:hypothetical protein
MTEHVPLLVIAGVLAGLALWLALAYRRYAKRAFPTGRRRTLSRWALQWR